MLSRCNQNKRKTVPPHIIYLICSLVSLRIISLQLVEAIATASAFHPRLFSVFTSLLRVIFAVIQNPCHKNVEKFQEFGESRLGGSENDIYFLKTQKWHHKLVRNYKRAKLTSYLLNNAAKTCLYELNVSENIDSEHIFQSKALSHPHASFLSVFNDRKTNLLVFLNLETEDRIYLLVASIK